MTYNEWRDELKNNLLTVTDNERRRVLDYYAEAYADRREAGFTEREIIDGFGAPYDAAQRILCENSDEYYTEPGHKIHKENKQRSDTPYEESRYDERDTYYEHETAHRQRRRDRARSSRHEGNWVYVLLCVVLAIPTFALIVAMIALTISLLVAPFGVLISGLGTVVAGISTLIYNLMTGLFTVGKGIILIGVGIMLIPICIKLSKWMWKLFKMFFRWLKKLCKGEKAYE